MTWHPVEPFQNPHTVAAEPFKIGVGIRGSGCLVITLRVEAIPKEWLARDFMIAVLAGGGPHHGKFRLHPSGTRNVRLGGGVRGGKSRFIRLPLPAGCPKEKRGGRPVEYAWDVDGALILTLPAWAIPPTQHGVAAPLYEDDPRASGRHASPAAAALNTAKLKAGRT